MVLVAFIFYLYNKQIYKELHGVETMDKCPVFLPPMLQYS